MHENSENPIGVLCVDDNPHVGEAVRVTLTQEADFSWKGWLPDADHLVDYAVEHCPGIVVIDIDMPGRDAFDALAELVERCPDTRVVMFSGYVRDDLINRAIASGAWGYVSKNDGEAELLRALRRVAVGEFALSSEVVDMLNKG